MTTQLQAKAVGAGPPARAGASPGPQDADERSSGLRRHPIPAADFASSPIHAEERWRESPLRRPAASGKTPSVSFSRWSATKIVRPIEARHDAGDDAHVISLAVRSTPVDFSDGDLQVRNMALQPQTLLLSPPTTGPRQAVFRQPYDMVRAFISQDLLKECWEATYGRPASEDITLFKTHFCQDDGLTRLMRCVVNANAGAAPLDLVFLEALGLSLSSQLLHTWADRRLPPRPAALSERRLNRVVEYIHAHLAQPIHLAPLADVVGLSRVYFASQFRAATGVSPHVYILRCRIDRAKALLCSAKMSISEIALSVGFNGQSQFTAAFRKAVGDTPYRWRKAARHEQRVPLPSDTADTDSGA